MSQVAVVDHLRTLPSMPVSSVGKRGESPPVRTRSPWAGRQVAAPVYSQPGRRWFSKRALETSFVLFGFATAIIFVLLFGLDLLLVWPFERAAPEMDIACILSAAGLGYLSWDAWQYLSRR